MLAELAHEKLQYISIHI